MNEAFFDRDPAVVAKDLLGGVLMRRCNGVWTGGFIVETEAYLSSDDPASHAHRGRMRGNQSMFGPPGHLYVYPIHAKHCLNIVTERIGLGSAVLIRALQPTANRPAMQASRGTIDPRRLTSGPAMICQAMDVDRSSDGLDVLRNSDWILRNGHAVADAQICIGPRIGVTQAAELPLRFFIDGNRFVSGRARDHRRPRRDELPALPHGSHDATIASK